MKPEEQIRELFSQALERMPAERGAFLEEACKDRPEVGSQVESLLRAHERAGDFLQRPPQLTPLGAKPARAVIGQKKAIVISEAAFTPRVAESKDHPFGDYELLGEIAHGGMGMIYKARQISQNRLVALKMILAGQLASKTEIKRFQVEAEAAAHLNHPNIVEIYEIGVQEGQHFFSMQYIEGRSLAQIEAEGKSRVGAGKEAGAYHFA